VTRLKRSTAPSTAWMPNARPQCRCQAPQPRSGAPKAQGLIAALRPQHNPPCRRSLPAAAPTANNISTGADAFIFSAAVPNLHHLDGRDQKERRRMDEFTSTPPFPFGLARL